MRVALSGHQLGRTLADTLGAPAAQEAAMIQEEPQQIQIRTGLCRVSRQQDDRVNCDARTLDESTCSISKGCVFRSMWSWSACDTKSLI